MAERPTAPTAESYFASAHRPGAMRPWLVVAGVAFLLVGGGALVSLVLLPAPPVREQVTSEDSGVPTLPGSTESFDLASTPTTHGTLTVHWTASAPLAVRLSTSGCTAGSSGCPTVLRSWASNASGFVLCHRPTRSRLRPLVDDTARRVGQRVGRLVGDLGCRRPGIDRAVDRRGGERAPRRGGRPRPVPGPLPPGRVPSAPPRGLPRSGRRGDGRRSYWPQNGAVWRRIRTTSSRTAVSVGVRVAVRSARAVPSVMRT